MKNLENYNVQELDTKEVQSIDGGGWWPWFGPGGLFFQWEIDSWDNTGGVHMT